MMKVETVLEDLKLKQYLQRASILVLIAFNSVDFIYPILYYLS